LLAIEAKYWLWALTTGAKIFPLRPFVVLALAHPDLIVMSIYTVDRSIGNEE